MPRNAESKATNSILVILCLLAGLYIASKLLLGAGLVDDAYIFMRYAGNIAGGLGPVFNPGEHVEGYTSPLWTLCVTVPAMLHLDVPVATMLLSALAGFATLIMLLLFCRTRLAQGKWWVAPVPALILATDPSFEYWAWSGMDTLIFAFLFFLSFWVFLAQVKSTAMPVAAGVCFFLAAFARLDILALLPVYLLFIYYFNRHEKALLWKKYLSFLAPGLLLALHFVWRYSYYDSWLPNTYYAKAGVPVGVLVQRGLGYTADFISAYALYLIALLFTVALLARFSEVLPDEWKLGIAIVATWIAYVTYVGGDHFAMFRFYVPVLPVMIFLFVSGIDLLSRRFQIFSRRTGVALLALLGVLTLITNVGVYRLHNGERAREEVQLANAWVEVGSWLKVNVLPDSTLASMVVGAIPYYSGLPTYDILGLTDREVATKGKVYLDGAIGHQKYDTDYILARRPNYIVYGTSGVYTEPVDRGLQSVDPFYYYGLRDLVNDPRTLSEYDFKVIKLDDGRYIELLQRK